MNTNIHCVLAKHNTVTCFDHWLVIVRPVKYIQLKLELQILLVWLYWDLSLWVVQCTDLKGCDTHAHPHTPPPHTHTCQCRIFYIEIDAVGKHCRRFWRYSLLVPLLKMTSTVLSSCINFYVKYFTLTFVCVCGVWCVCGVCDVVWCVCVCVWGWVWVCVCVCGVWMGCVCVGVCLWGVCVCVCVSVCVTTF